MHPSPPPAPKSNRKFGLRFFAILVLTILFVGIFVPFFSHTGPTRKLQGRLAQEAIECLSDQIAKWEKDHPSASPVDLDDIREHDADRAYVKPESQLFMAYLNDHSQATRPDHVWGFSFLGRILSHPEWNLHRQTPSNGQSNEVRVSTLFQYSRGPQDELFEFHSWERKPMEQYMAFAQRKEIMKVISMSAGPFFIWLTLSIIVFFLLRPKTSSPNDPPTSIDRNPQ